MKLERYILIGVAEREVLGLENNILAIRSLQWFPVILSLKAPTHHEMVQLRGICLR